MRRISKLASSLALASALIGTSTVGMAGAASISQGIRATTAAMPGAVRQKQDVTPVSIEVSPSETYLPVHTIGDTFSGLTFPRDQFFNELVATTPANLTAFANVLTLAGPGVLRVSGDGLLVKAPGFCPISSKIPSSEALLPALVRLSQLATASGWKVIYGLDLNYGLPCQTTPAAAAAEASYARTVLGTNLIGYEIGNNLDLIDGRLGTLNQIHTFEATWEALRTAMVQADPRAVFYGPGAYGLQPSFVQTFLHDKGSELSGVDQHFYEPKPDPAFLLNQRSYVSDFFLNLQRLSRQTELPNRVGELDEPPSALGLTGLPDTGLTALSLIPFLYELSEAGSSGFNLTSTPEDKSAAIALLNGSVVNVNPLYDALVFFRLATVGGRLVNVSTNAQSSSLQTFASMFPDGSISTVIVNTDPFRAAQATLRFPFGGEFAHAISLNVAPGTENNVAGNSTTIGGVNIAPDGSFMPVWGPTESAAGFSTTVAPLSAVLVRTTNVPPPPSQSIVGLFSTGLGPNGAPLNAPYGGSAPDAHWAINTDQAINPSFAHNKFVPAIEGTPAFLWFSDAGAGGLWLEGNWGNAYQAVAPGAWTYATTFGVPPSPPSTSPAELKIPISLAADNGVTAVYVNGHAINVPNLSAVNFQTLTPVVIDVPGEYLLPGARNEIAFQVLNTGTTPNPSGFLAIVDGPGIVSY